MNSKNKSVKEEKRKEAAHFYYHGKLSIDKIAEKMKKSPRTIYRWLEIETHPRVTRQQDQAKKCQNRSPYPKQILNRILELKQENSRRSARIIRNMLESERFLQIPSEPTIRRHLVNNGLGRIAAEAKRGFVIFQREKPNELWQTDIAGVQTVGHLGPLYLFAFLDDCSRFVPAAFYVDNQKGYHVIQLLQQATTNYGRPLAILADNGTQFRNVLTDLDSKFEKILKLLDIKPIYARVRHPQTKGKLERFFGTVKTMFLSEARFQVKQHPEWTLTDFNQELKKWLEFYNTKHRHRSLPKRCSPAEVYFNKENRIYRPIEVQMDWERWMKTTETRKVSKTNFISYQGERLAIPPGYAGLQVELWRIGQKLEIYRSDQCLVRFDLNTDFYLQKKAHTRRIAQNGSIGYGGKYYSISYKMAGQQVLVKETADGLELLIYAQDQLIQRIPKKS